MGEKHLHFLQGRDRKKMQKLKNLSSWAKNVLEETHLALFYREENDLCSVEHDVIDSIVKEYKRLNGGVSDRVVPDYDNLRIIIYEDPLLARVTGVVHKAYQEVHDKTSIKMLRNMIGWHGRDERKYYVQLDAREQDLLENLYLNELQNTGDLQVMRAVITLSVLPTSKIFSKRMGFNVFERFDNSVDINSTIYVEYVGYLLDKRDINSFKKHISRAIRNHAQTVRGYGLSREGYDCIQDICDFMEEYGSEGQFKSYSDDELARVIVDHYQKIAEEKAKKKNKKPGRLWHGLTLDGEMIRRWRILTEEVELYGCDSWKLDYILSGNIDITYLGEDYVYAEERADENSPRYEKLKHLRSIEKDLGKFDYKLKEYFKDRLRCLAAKYSAKDLKYFGKYILKDIDPEKNRMIKADMGVIFSRIKYKEMSEKQQDLTLQYTLAFIDSLEEE